MLNTEEKFLVYLIAIFNHKTNNLTNVYAEHRRFYK